MPFMAWKMILSEALNSHNLIQRSSLPLTPLKLKFDAGKTFVLFIAAARCKAGARCDWASAHMHACILCLGPF